MILLTKRELAIIGCRIISLYIAILSLSYAPAQALARNAFEGVSPLCDWVLRFGWIIFYVVVALLLWFLAGPLASLVIPSGTSRGRHKSAGWGLLAVAIFLLGAFFATRSNVLVPYLMFGRIDPVRFRAGVLAEATTAVTALVLLLGAGRLAGMVSRSGVLDGDVAEGGGENDQA